MLKPKSFIITCDGKTWDVEKIEINKPVFIHKLIAGKYTGSYEVIPVTEVVERSGTRAFLALTETHIDDYFVCISDYDLVADTEEKLKVLRKKYLKS